MGREREIEVSPLSSSPSSVSSTVAQYNESNPAHFKPSNFRVPRGILKLLPTVISLRRDRREWVKKEGKGVDEAKYRRHAEKALLTFISLGPSYIKLGQWLSSRADIL